MASREQGYTTYAPRSFSFCPVTSEESFASGFGACARLVSGTYSHEPAPLLVDAGHGNFTSGSVSWNYTMRAAMANNGVNDCGPDYTAHSQYTPGGLSCVQQVRLAPFILPGGGDDSFFSCTREARARATSWDEEGSNWAQAIIVSVVFALVALPSVLFVLWILLKRKLNSKASGSSAATPPPATELESHAKSGGDAGRVYLSFSDVYYSVTLNSSAQKAKLAAAKAEGKTPKDMPKFWDVKCILKGVSGAFSPGSLSAIMGPSGCGKSTMLNVLADRMRTGNTAGSVLLNGSPRGKCFKRACGYVEQSDALFEQLTVREVFQRVYSNPRAPPQPCQMMPLLLSRLFLRRIAVTHNALTPSRAAFILSHRIPSSLSYRRCSRTRRSCVSPARTLTPRPRVSTGSSGSSTSRRWRTRPSAARPRAASLEGRSDA